MSSLAEQIKELQLKLAQINEEPVAAFNQNAGTVPDGAADSAASDASAGSVAVAPEEVPAATTTAQDPNQIPTIEAATFSQAYAQAVKQGLKKFKWTGTYAVKAQTSPVQTQPSTTKTKFQPPANVTAPGPNSTILRPGGGVDVNKLMTQQAAPANTNRPEFKPFR